MVDVIVVLSVFAIFKIGYDRGIISELTDIVALILSIIAVLNFTPLLTNLLKVYFNIPSSSYVYMIVGVILFFISFFLVLAIGYGLELYSRSNEILGDLNKLVGGIIAVIKAILMWWAIFLIVWISPTQGYFKEYLLSSISAEYLLKLTPYIHNVSKFVFPKEINVKIEKLIKGK